MTLSEQLKQDHASGDFGKALEGYAERAEALEAEVAEKDKRIAELEAGIESHQATAFFRNQEIGELRQKVLGFEIENAELRAKLEERELAAKTYCALWRRCAEDALRQRAEQESEG